MTSVNAPNNMKRNMEDKKLSWLGSFLIEIVICFAMPILGLLIPYSFLGKAIYTVKTWSLVFVILLAIPVIILIVDIIATFLVPYFRIIIIKKDDTSSLNAILNSKLHNRINPQTNKQKIRMIILRIIFVLSLLSFIAITSDTTINHLSPILSLIYIYCFSFFTLPS